MAVKLEIVKELVDSVMVTAEVDIGAMVGSPNGLPIEWRVEFEERAAILEFDGGLSREKADSQALQEIIERLKRL